MNHRDDYRIPLDIAGVKVILTGSDLHIRHQIVAEFGGFRTRCPDEGYEIAVSAGLPEHPANRETPYVVPDETRLRIVDARNELTLDRTSKRGSMACTSWTTSGSSSAPCDPGSHLRALVAVELASTGGLLLHASAVKIGSGACVFLGVSGAGKTTLSRMFPEDCVLNDELVAMRFQDGMPFAMATPFSGETNTPRVRRDAPIQLLAVLEKADSTRLVPMDFRAGFTTLMRCVSLPEGTDDLERVTFDTAHRFAMTRPPAKFMFAPHQDEVRRVLATASRGGR